MLDVFILEVNCWDDNLPRVQNLFCYLEKAKKVCELDFEELGIVLEDVEIPLLVITMLFSYKGRGTQQIWSSLCLQPDVPLSDLT